MRMGLGGRGTAGSLGLVAGFLRSRSGTGGGVASLRGRLSQGHQVESNGRWTDPIGPG